MLYFGGTVEAENFDEAVAALRKRTGENLRTLREMRGLSLTQVSEAIGNYVDDNGRERPIVSAESIRNYENGETSNYEKYWALADFYGVPLGSLGGRIRFEAAEVA
jgi:transcriptional regulator with XRE-family HTH domain